MRVVAGSLGGRVFSNPTHSSSHPMGEKIRGALFSALGDISELSFLDAFSGSGAISFEAVSRSAKSSLAIDSNKYAQAVIAQNIQSLDLGDKVKLIKTSLLNWSERNREARFDIVVCDPPYGDLQHLSVIRAAEHLNNNGVFILSWPPNEQLPELAGLEVKAQKNYGDSELVFYKKTK